MFIFLSSVTNCSQSHLPWPMTSSNKPPTVPMRLTRRAPSLSNRIYTKPTQKMSIPSSCDSVNSPRKLSFKNTYNLNFSGESQCPPSDVEDLKAQVLEIRNDKLLMETKLLAEIKELQNQLKFKNGILEEIRNVSKNSQKFASVLLKESQNDVNVTSTNDLHGLNMAIDNLKNMAQKMEEDAARSNTSTVKKLVNYLANSWKYLTDEI